MSVKKEKRFLLTAILMLALCCTALPACGKKETEDGPSLYDRTIALHATIVEIGDDFVDVTITDMDQGVVYTVTTEDCSFHVDRESLSEGDQILVIPAEEFHAGHQSFAADKIFSDSE